MIGSLSFKISPSSLKDYLISAALDNSLSEFIPVFPPSSPSSLITIESCSTQDLHNCKGRISSNEVSCEFSYNAERHILSINITRKPFHLTYSIIESGLRESINLFSNQYTK